MTTGFWCEYAWLPPGEVRAGVTVEVEADYVSAVIPDTAPSKTLETLPGFTIPGMANVHSHAFHRVLRGRTQTHGTFWTWRDQMYDIAERLDPDTYYDLAERTYVEMRNAGISRVGEFHYLHHGPGGVPYDDPNAMGQALIRAARDAGLRITLLDACYLTGGIDRPLENTQRRFGDGDAERWAIRVEELHQAYRDDPNVVIGAAIHSVRAVPPDQLGIVAEWAKRHHAPLHIHVSEQPSENVDCMGAYRTTPTQLLYDSGILGPTTTAVHATHLNARDIMLLGESGTTIAMCPTTERDLADGIGPAAELAKAGSPIALGSDSHAVIDLFEEARAVELDERLRSGLRGHWSPGELLRMATENGHRALGCSTGGVLAPGAWADLVTVRLDSPRTADLTDLTDCGTLRTDSRLEDVRNVPESAAGVVVFAATAADVAHVVAIGRTAH